MEERHSLRKQALGDGFDTKSESLVQYFDTVRQEIGEQCIACGECLKACPSFSNTLYAKEDPSTIMEKMVAVLNDGIYSPEAYETAISCILCGLCHESCPQEIPVVMMMVATSVTLKRMGHQLPVRGEQIMPCQPYSFVNLITFLQMEPLPMEQTGRTSWITGSERWVTEVPENPRPTELVVTTGCQALAVPHGIYSIINILEAMKTDFVIVGAPDLCCGAMCMHLGELENAEREMNGLFDAINAFKPKQVLHMCVGCDETYRHIYSGNLNKELSFKNEHLRIFLADNLDKISFTTPINKTVTIMDSCGSRVTDEYESIRNLLRGIPGLKIVEMQHNREEGLCCGSYGNFLRPERNHPVRKRVLEEAAATGAEILVSVCSTCYSTLAPQESGYPFQIVWYPVLLAQALGFNYTDVYKELVLYGNPDEILAQNTARIHKAGLDPFEIAWRLPMYLNQWK